ncbi:MAG TPA: hypothetical protein VFF73_12765 [Planctomycetota bacterium]|nr:hypothetical protein [Planctomycetota bacterium]
MSQNDHILPRNAGEIRACLQAMSLAIPTNIGPNEQVMLKSVSYGRADLQKKVDDALAVYNQTADAEAAFHKMVGQRNEAEPGVAEMIDYFLTYLQNRFSKTDPVLEKFGFRARKDASLTVEQKAEKVQKMRQTRQKNHTMGTRQKQALDRSGAPPPAEPGKGPQV